MSHNISFATSGQAESLPDVAKDDEIVRWLRRCTISFCDMYSYTPLVTYSEKVRRILPPDMRRLFSQLNFPSKIQSYLDTLSINFELLGDTMLSPIEVMRQHTAHCFEGAVFAASVLAFHGRMPLLMDFATAYDDEDHTVALFRENGLWGAISKTNHAVLKYRDAIYRTPRELAMSYFHEYYLWDGRKSLRAYSAPFDLSKYPPGKWITSGESLDWVMDALAKSRYFPIIPKNFERHLRKASKVELRALEVVDYKKDDTA